MVKWWRLTWVPKQLHGNADPPPLSPGHASNIVVPHPRVCTLPQTQLGYDIINLRHRSRQT